jgi:hypothetical protein
MGSSKNTLDGLTAFQACLLHRDPSRLGQDGAQEVGLSQSQVELGNEGLQPFPCQWPEQTFPLRDFRTQERSLSPQPGVSLASPLLSSPSWASLTGLPPGLLRHGNQEMN